MARPFTWDIAVVTNTKGRPDYKPFRINKTKIVTITYTYKQCKKRECLPSRHKFQRLRIVSETGASFLRLSKLFANNLRSELLERENSIPMFYKSGFCRLSACNNNARSKIYERPTSLRDLGTNKDTQCTLGYENSSSSLGLGFHGFRCRVGCYILVKQEFCLVFFEELGRTRFVQKQRIYPLDVIIINLTSLGDNNRIIQKGVDFRARFPLNQKRASCLQASWTLGSVSTLWLLAGEQGWLSGESTCLPPVWAGFDSRSRRHMWIEFFVGSRPCSERLFSWYSGFPLSSKTNISKFQFDLESVPN